MNRVQRRQRQGESGFTLIELLVVIAILGVLAGIVIFNVSGVTNRGSTAACNTDVSTIQAAVDAYRNNPASGTPAGDANANGSPGAPPTTATLFSTLVPNYIHTTPTACASYAIDAGGTVTGVPK